MTSCEQLSLFVGYSGWSMIVIVSWAVEINLVYLREDRSDCDEFLASRHIVVIFL